MLFALMKPLLNNFQLYWLLLRLVLKFSFRLKKKSLTLKIEFFPMKNNKTIKIVLEIIKLVATALLGYFGGNAVM